MDKKHNTIPESHYQDNDEIDLIELLIKVWRWRWLTAALVIIITATAFLYVQFSPGPPKTYTVITSLKIGTVGAYHVQSPEMIINSVKAELFAKARQEGYKIKDTTQSNIQSNIQNNTYQFNTKMTDSNEKLILNLNFTATEKSIEFSIKTQSAKESVKWARMIGDFITNKHRPLYASAVKQAQAELSELKKMSVYVGSEYINMKLLYENQNYPTDYMIEPFAPSGPDPNSGKKIMLKTAAAFIASLFFGIFLSFLIDYISAIRQEMRKRSGKG